MLKKMPEPDSIDGRVLRLLARGRCMTRDEIAGWLGVDIRKAAAALMGLQKLGWSLKCIDGAWEVTSERDRLRVQDALGPPPPSRTLRRSDTQIVAEMTAEAAVRDVARELHARGWPVARIAWAMTCSNSTVQRLLGRAPAAQSVSGRETKT